MAPNVLTYTRSPRTQTLGNQIKIKFLLFIGQRISESRRPIGGDILGPDIVDSLQRAGKFGRTNSVGNILYKESTKIFPIF